jgi:hypothetical protein
MKHLITIGLITALLFSTFSLAYAEDGWLTATLRTDLSALRTAQDYITIVDIQQLPTQLGQLDDGYLKTYSTIAPSIFMEVGISIAKPEFANPPRVWYVKASGYTVQCLRGFSIGDYACSGERNDSLTATDAEYRLELVTYGGGFWIVRVQNMTTLQIADVAKIFNSTTTVEKVFASTWIQEGGVSSPPNVGSFVHKFPSYMVWGSGFQLWPASSGGNNNTLVAGSLNGCPSFYSAKVFSPRVWLAGYSSIPGSCNINPLF